eukprot:555676-Pleurochrysis_carterae.AAC.1
MQYQIRPIETENSMLPAYRKHDNPEWIANVTVTTSVLDMQANAFDIPVMDGKAFDGSIQQP